MTEAVQIALITLAEKSIPTIFAAIGAWFGWRASVHGKNAASNSRIAASQSILTEKNTNSMKDELVRVNRADARAEGHAQGVIDGQAAATKGELDRRL